MTSSGVPPSGAGGVDEPDWIDRILDRATEQVAAASPAERAEPTAGPRPATASRPAVPAVPAPSESTRASTGRPADSLADIRWVDTTNVTPASTPIVPTQAAAELATPVPTQVPTSVPTQVPTGLVASAVGRSAWDDDLRNIGDSEPDGWDKLSWQDLDESQARPADSLPEQTNFGRLLREWGPVLFAAVAIALFTRLVLVQAYHIPSSSMVPTLEIGDRVVVNRQSYQFGEIERGQVVVFAKPSGTEGENDLIKRVIGLPGETIRFVDNQVYINGLRVEEPYLAEQNSTQPRLQIPGCAQVDLARDLCQIPQGHVFMMGDNRRGSSDSRVFGPVPVDDVVGRAFLRVWPLNSVGLL